MARAGQVGLAMDDGGGGAKGEWGLGGGAARQRFREVKSGDG